MNEGLSSHILPMPVIFCFVIIAILMVWSVQMCFLFLLQNFPIEEVRMNGWSGESWLESFLMRERSCKNPVLFIIFISYCTVTILLCGITCNICVWLISLSIAFSRFIHIVSIKTSLFFYKLFYIVVNIYKIIRLSENPQFGSFLTVHLMLLAGLPVSPICKMQIIISISGNLGKMKNQQWITLCIW